MIGTVVVNHLFWFFVFCDKVNETVVILNGVKNLGYEMLRLLPASNVFGDVANAGWAQHDAKNNEHY